MKKQYNKPQIKTEELKVGVYGDYGSSTGGGPLGSFIGALNPLFRLCCS